METCLPGSGTLGWGAPCSPGGTSAADIHLLKYISLLGVGQARCVSPPLTPFSLGLLYILYRSRRASGQPDFRQFGMMVVLVCNNSLVIILV